MRNLAARLRNLDPRRLLFEREVLGLMGMTLLVKPIGLLNQVLIARYFRAGAEQRYDQHCRAPICYIVTVLSRWIRIDPGGVAMRCGAAIAVMAVVVLVMSLPAQAARFHVLPGGERTSGPSTPNDWTAANCYPNLALGFQAAGPADTLLLSLDDHLLGTLETLPAVLSNRYLDDRADICRILIGEGGGLRIATIATGTIVRGVSFVADDPATGLPALRILAPAKSGSTVLVESCVFSGLVGAASSSLGGAAIHMNSSEYSLAVDIRDCRFLDCSGTGRGGAIFAGNGIDLAMFDCVLEHNEARNTGSTAYGGAIAVIGEARGSSLTLDRCLFVDSVSWGPGGAIYVQDGHLTMRDTDVRGSRSAFGGVSTWSAGAGVFVRRTGSDPQPVTVVAERCRFIDNRGELTQAAFAGDGGGMMLRGSDHGSMTEASIVDCLFEDNFNDQGAGLYVGRGATATVERTLFLNNTALRCGGGSYKGGELAANLGETALFIYCVFAGNRAGWDQHGQPYADEGFGGAFMTRRSPRAEFHNCTFADNLSGPITSRGDAIYNWSEGTGYWDDLQRSRLVNCLFYGSEGNDVQVRSDPGGFTEVLHCAWEPGQFVAAGVTPGGTVLLSGSPFDPLADWSLAQDSSCIDAGAFLGHDTDFAGAPVPSGLAPDIGAFEYPFPVGVADNGAGAAAATLDLLPARPNPANPRTEFAFALGRSTTARLTVHDLSGRLVAVLADRRLPAGEHRAVWDGRTLAGSATPSGMYLVRLSAGAVVVASKVMLVR